MPSGTGTTGSGTTGTGASPTLPPTGTKTTSGGSGAGPTTSAPSGTKSTPTSGVPTTTAPEPSAGRRATTTTAKKNGTSSTKTASPSAGSESLTAAATAPTTTVATLTRVDPYVVCVADGGQGRWIAHFGYRNSGAEVHIPTGARNAVMPGAYDQGQPERFKRNGSDKAFEMPFTGWTATWLVDGRAAIASRNSTRC
jgi:hypothetical protein